jgi:catechol 2,3-dioxygenase-like lactoylglutathione lyase family enzyme
MPKIRFNDQANSRSTERTDSSPMALNHLNLSVPDIVATSAFLEQFFGLKRIATRGSVLIVLGDETGFTLVLNQFKKAAGFSYPDDFDSFHVGFRQESRERVDEVHAALTAGGYEPPPPREYHGAWTFYVKAPGGFFVEVFHQHRMT